MLPDPNPNAIAPVDETERELAGHFRQKRTPAEKVRDLEEISALYLRGKKPGEIAQALVERHHYEGLSAKTIQLDLAELRKLWVQSALINYDEAKAREIAHIDELEAEAWTAWNRSWGKQATVTEEGIDDRYGHKGDAEEELEKKPTTYMRKRTTSVVREKLGDPRYLDVVKWCIERRCKILGLDEPTRLAISWEQEATKAGISIDDAKQIYEIMLGTTTKLLRDQYLKDHAIDVPADVLEGDYKDSDDIPDGYED